jgi:CheY-like chemotaxis protein
MSDNATTRKTVLVVEDERIVAIMAQAMLKSLGYDTIHCADGASAIETFEQEHAQIAFVLLDMLLPDVDGPQLYGSLRSIDSSLKCLLSSGLTMDESIETLLAEGADGFIQKPFKLAEFKAAIDRLFSS